jgi:hypothetical protein
MLFLSPTDIALVCVEADFQAEFGLLTDPRNFPDVDIRSHDFPDSALVRCSSSHSGRALFFQISGKEGVVAEASCAERVWNAPFYSLVQ